MEAKIYNLQFHYFSLKQYKIIEVKISESNIIGLIRKFLNLTSDIRQNEVQTGFGMNYSLTSFETQKILWENIKNNVYLSNL